MQHRSIASAVSKELPHHLHSLDYRLFYFKYIIRDWVMVSAVESQAFLTFPCCLNFSEKSKLLSHRFGQNSVSKGLQYKQAWPEIHRFTLSDLTELTVTRHQGYGAALGFYLCI